MQFSMAHPFLYCLPPLVCLLLHIMISLGFLSETRKGILRIFMYLVSSLFLLLYLLILNQSVNQATTLLEINTRDRNMTLRNHYGHLQIPYDTVEALVVEGSLEEPRAIWVISDSQSFYLDRNFTNYSSMLTTVLTMGDFAKPQSQGDEIIYWNKNRPPRSIGFSLSNNTLSGSTIWFLPWLALSSIWIYILGQKAWAGKYKYFFIIMLLYGLPAGALTFLFTTSLTTGAFMVFYPMCLLLMCAMCIPDS